MSDNTEFFLGNGQHTLYSDEEWYLIIPPGSANPFLEARFQTDAPERTGYPAWSSTESCVLREGEIAICRLPLTRVPQPGEQNRFATVPDAIWSRAVEECAKNVPHSAWSA